MLISDASNDARLRRVRFNARVELMASASPRGATHADRDHPVLERNPGSVTLTQHKGNSSINLEVGLAFLVREY